MSCVCGWARYRPTGRQGPARARATQREVFDALEETGRDRCRLADHRQQCRGGAIGSTAEPDQQPRRRARQRRHPGQSNLDRRGYGIYIVGAIVLGLIVWGIIELTNKNDNPHSP